MTAALFKDLGALAWSMTEMLKCHKVSKEKDLRIRREKDRRNKILFLLDCRRHRQRRSPSGKKALYWWKLRFPRHL